MYGKMWSLWKKEIIVNSALFCVSGALYIKKLVLAAVSRLKKKTHTFILTQPIINYIYWIQVTLLS